MRRRYPIVWVFVFSLAMSFCSPEHKKAEAVKSIPIEGFKKQQGTSCGKCCVSNIPSRFPIKNKNILQPATSR